jgi:hypothetical protein
MIPMRNAVPSRYPPVATSMLIAINCLPCGRRSPLLLERDGRREAVIEDAEKTQGAHRDLEHGDGGKLGLPTKLEDLEHDD